MSLRTLEKDSIPDFIKGVVIAIDKPLEWTSFDVVKRIRNRLCRTLQVKKFKVGHAGTLDPLATGLLLICSGKYTKEIEGLQNTRKEYTGTITLGATRPSYDMETEIDETYDVSGISKEDIYECSKQFVGDIIQKPPVFSALKKDGERLYKKARRGEEVDIPGRPVTIYDFEITKIELPEVHFRVECSKGTYIRSLAYDFGKALNNGAYLSQLTRTKVGNFELKDAWNLNDAIEYIDSIKEKLDYVSNS